MDKILAIGENVTLREKGVAPSAPEVISPGEVKIGIRGRFSMVHTKENGEVDTYEYDNLIVDAGFDLICDVLGNPTQPNDLSHIAVGTDATAPAAGNTDLGTVLAPRQPTTYAHTPGTKVFTSEYTFAAGESTGAWAEAGLFNAVTGGSMLNRVTFATVNKGAGDTITAKFTITLS